MYIFDIDGTLADASHRVHYILDVKDGEKVGSKHWDKFLAEAENDNPIPAMAELIRTLYRHGYITLSTGRREDQRQMTQKWLRANRIPWDVLLMRPTGDRRSDTIVKPEILLDRFGQGSHPIEDVITIFEDRKRVTKAWRDLGYHVCQVAEGDY